MALELTQKEFLYIGHGSNPERIHEFTKETFVRVVGEYIAEDIGFHTAIGDIWPQDVAGLVEKLHAATEDDIRQLIAKLDPPTLSA